MIDNIALALSHGLLILAAWLLLRRPDLDREGPPPPRGPRGHGAGDGAKAGHGAKDGRGDA